MELPVLSPSTQRYLALLVACFSKFLSGTSSTFCIFAADLKRQFHLSQSAVEAILSVANVGAQMGYPAGLLYEKIGLRPAWLLTLVVATGSSILFYTTQFSVEFYQDFWQFLLVYWTLWGISTIYTSLLPLTICLGNFAPSCSGRISGFLYMFSYVGISSVNAIYATFFNHGPVGNFFLFLAVLGTLFNAMSLVFIQPVTPEDEDKPLNECAIPKRGLFVEEKTEKEENSEPSWAERTGLTQFIQFEYQLLLWAFLCSGSIKLMYLPNLTTFATSYGIAETGDLMAIFGPTCAMASSSLLAPLSDVTQNYLPRVGYLFFGACVQSFALLMSSYHGHSMYVYVLTTFVVFLDLGILFPATIAVCREYFGLAHFPRNWGLIQSLNAIFALGTCAVFGAIYEAAIEEEGETNCYGLVCFRNTYIFGAGVTAISAMLFAILWYKDRKQTRKVCASVPLPLEKQ